MLKCKSWFNFCYQPSLLIYTRLEIFWCRLYLQTKEMLHLSIFCLFISIFVFFCYLLSNINLFYIVLSIFFVCDICWILAIKFFFFFFPLQIFLSSKSRNLLLKECQNPVTVFRWQQHWYCFCFYCSHNTSKYFINSFYVIR